MSQNRPITRLLNEWRAGDRAALDRVVTLVYDDLREIAARAWRGESRQVTLEPTSIAHEAYLRLAELKDIEWQDRTHFLAMAARVVRRILVDHARSRASARRRAGTAVTLANLPAEGAAEPLDLLSLEETLDELAAFDAEGARIVELRVFGGLTGAEIAEVLGTSPATVKRRWRAARAWLHHRLRHPDDDERAPDQ